MKHYFHFFDCRESRNGVPASHRVGGNHARHHQGVRDGEHPGVRVRPEVRGRPARRHLEVGRLLGQRALRQPLHPDVHRRVQGAEDGGRPDGDAELPSRPQGPYIYRVAQKNPERHTL